MGVLSGAMKRQNSTNWWGHIALLSLCFECKNKYEQCYAIWWMGYIAPLMFGRNSQHSASWTVYITSQKHTVVKPVYDELRKLNWPGVDTRVTRVSDITQNVCLDIDMATTEFKQLINNFISMWEAELQDLDKNSTCRYYNKINHRFGMEN